MGMKSTKYEFKDYKVKAVVYEPDEKVENNDVMVYCHGLNSVDKDNYPTGYEHSDSFEDTSRNFQSLREQLGSNQPRYTIAISFGKTWILSDEETRKKGANKNATFKNFRSVLFNIEDKHGINFDSHKIVGHSMGGWNAIQLAINEQTAHLFDRCVAIDSMMPLPEFRSGNPINWAINGILGLIRGGPIVVMEGELPEEVFHRLNPLTGQRHKFNKDMIPMLLQSNLNSEWNFSATHEELEYHAHAQGADEKFKLIGNLGRHSFVQYVEVAEFLTKEF